MHKDVELNKIFVYVRDLDKDKQKSIEKFVKHPAIEYVKSENIGVEQSTELVAGSAILTSIDGQEQFSKSTFSFCAYREELVAPDTYGLIYGFVMSGHGTDYEGQPVYLNYNDYTNGEYVGLVSKRINSGSVDAAFVDIDSSKYECNNKLANGNNINYVSISNFPQGTQVAMHGAVSGTQFGEILDDSASAFFISSGWFTDLVKADYDDIKGDSGAPITIQDSDNVTLIGVHKGRVVNAFFTKFSNIKNELEITFDTY